MNEIIDFICQRLSQFGNIPICNGIAERAPHIFGFCFPLCYRCTFIVIMFLITLYMSYKYKKTLPIMIIILCMLPMIIDGSLQTFWGIMSNNLRRAFTGAVFGFALGLLVTKAYIYIDKED